MKRVLLSTWLLATLTLGFTGTADWPLVAGLVLLPAFSIGKPWYSGFTKKIAEHK